MADTIPEGATLKAKWIPDGGVIMRQGAVLKALSRAEWLAEIQSAVTDGTLPIILNGKQLAIAGDGTVSAEDPA